MSTNPPTNQTAGSWPRTRNHDGSGSRNFAVLASPVKNDGPHGYVSIYNDVPAGNPIVHGIMRRYATDAIFDDTPEIDLSKTDPDFFIKDENKTGVITKKTNKKALIWNTADEYFLTGNNTGVYTRGSQTLPASFNINRDLSAAKIESAMSVETYNVFEQSLKPRPRQRSSLTGVFDIFLNDIVAQDDGTDLDYVFAAPEIPDDLPVRGTLIKSAPANTSSLKSKKIPFREVSANIQLSRQSSVDSLENDIKKNGVSKINFKEVVILKLASNKFLQMVVPHVHPRVEICRQENAINRTNTIHPSMLDLPCNHGSTKIANRKSTLSNTEKAFNEIVPYAQPRLELIRNEITIDGTESLHPSKLHLRRLNGVSKIHLQKSALSTITLPITAIKKFSCQEIALDRMHSIHPSKLNIRIQLGYTKAPFRKSSLSTVQLAIYDVKVLEPMIKSRAHGMLSEPMKSPLRYTDSVHPSILNESRPRVNRASTLTAMDFSHPEVAQHTITPRSRIVRRLSEMPHYGWSDSIHPTLLNTLHSQGLTAASVQRVTYDFHNY